MNNIINILVIIFFAFPLALDVVITGSLVSNWCRKDTLDDLHGVLAREVGLLKTAKNLGVSVNRMESDWKVTLICNLVIIFFNAQAAFSTSPQTMSIYIFDVVIFGIPYFHYHFVEKQNHKFGWFYKQGPRNKKNVRSFYYHALVDYLFDFFAINAPVIILAIADMK